MSKKEKKDSKPLHGRKPYPFALGRTQKKFTMSLYGDNEEFCRKEGLKLGFSSGPAAHYLNYLVDRERGFVKRGDNNSFIVSEAAIKKTISSGDEDVD